MSWIARSIANSLKLDDEEEEDQKHEESQQKPSSDPSTPRGVKEDISELTKTLSRQFRGFASFLAPDPDPDSVNTKKPDGKEEDEEEEEEELIKGIKSDFAEIGGRFKSGIFNLSNNINVSEISKIATNFLQFGSEGRDLKEEEIQLIGSVVGVTEEVVAFIRDISMHPETWLDFPVPDDDEFEDFDMSDAQQEHALAVERLAPRLAALRIELCPGCMSEGCFWKIYFVLLHPRLSKDDALLLSTPQIAEARAMLSSELQKMANANPGPIVPAVDTSRSKETSDLPREESLSVPSHSMMESVPVRSSVREVIPHTSEAKESISVSVFPSVAAELETEKHPVQTTEMTIIDKTVVEEQPSNQTRNQHSSSTTSSKVPDENFEDDADDWLKEETSEIVGGNLMSLENEEDVSFSDLEEDDEDVATSYKKVISGSDSSVKSSQDWVQLSRSSNDGAKDINPVTVKNVKSGQLGGTKESSDWLDVDDIDAI